MSDDENICPDCGAPWDDHEFAVPSPICPTKTAAKSEQPTSDTPIDPFSKCIQAYFSDPHHGPATSEMLNCASAFCAGLLIGWFACWAWVCWRFP